MAFCLGNSKVGYNIVTFKSWLNFLAWDLVFSYSEISQIHNKFCIISSYLPKLKNSISGDTKMVQYVNTALVLTFSHDHIEITANLHY